MTPATAPNMLDAALQAWDAGLCVIRAATDGTKRPYGEWKRYQSQRPTRQQVETWFRDGWPAMGTICGAVSGDLEMFELEGRFIQQHGTTGFVERMKEHGLELLFARIVRDGMVTISPTDGRHFIYRVQGRVDGNTKLAYNTNHETLIETRGEGGFVMLPPSHGTTHPSGKPWTISKGTFAKIPTITAEERDALFAVARTFNDAPPAPPPTPPTPNRKATIGRHGGLVGDSWFDAVRELLNANNGLRNILEAHGWTYEYTDRHGREMFKRPGKDTDGISGSINDNGRLIVFSSSTPFEFYQGAGKTRTYDALGVLAMYEHGGDEPAAARHVAEHTGIMQAWRERRDRQFVHNINEPDHVDPDTGEIPTPSHDDLWERRDVFRHIRDAARSRLVSPYAVLGCVLARVAAFTPPTLVIPPIVGGTAPLSLYVALQGASGDGKSSPVECAASLLPNIPNACRGPLPMGSGEGFVEAFLERTSEKDDKGKAKTGFKQAYHGILFELDEGEFLTDVGSRKGSTVLPILRSAWSGKELGQANASAETKRLLRAKRYNIGLVSLWQEDAGLNLLADAVGGTPQRFVWIPTADRTLTRELLTWPGPLNWDPPTINRIGDDWFHTSLDVPDDIIEEIRNYRWDVLQRVITPNPLDSHRNLNKLKLAGILAVLDNRRGINHDDWQIAESIMCISDAVRDGLVERGKAHAADKVRSEGVRHAIRDAVVEKSARDRALDRAARAAWRACDTANGVTSRRAITQRIAGRDREHVTVDDAISHAISLQWIDGNEATGWRPGKAKPT